MMFNNAPRAARPMNTMVKKRAARTTGPKLQTSMPMAKAAKRATAKPQMVKKLKPAVRIPTKSKIRKSTGEIKNPTRADVRKYNSMYKTIR